MALVRSGPLNNGRSRNSGDTRALDLSHVVSPTLNKGRSRNSGDTFTVSDEWRWLNNAQQRPEPKLRRHAHTDDGNTGSLPRSTKAGAETPATRTSRQCCRPGHRDAQQRPEPKLRRHGEHLHRVHDGAARSTKAGAETPATPVNPRCYFLCAIPPLNKGRSRNSGDTWRV